MEENRRGGLEVRLRKLYERTRSVVRTKEGVTSAFETRKEVEQQYIRHICYNNILFTLYIADLDSGLQKRSSRRTNCRKLWET